MPHVMMRISLEIPAVFATVDFGCGGDVAAAWAAQRTVEPSGPLVNSEFYPGWLDHWQSPHSRVSSDCVAGTLDQMLALGARYLQIPVLPHDNQSE